MNVALFGQASQIWTLADNLSRTRFGVVFGAPSHEAGHEIAEQFVITFQRAVQGGSYSRAARICDVVLFSEPPAFILSEEEGVKEVLRGKVVIDLMDLFRPATGGRGPSDAQNLRSRLPDANTVTIHKLKAQKHSCRAGRYQAQASGMSDPKTTQIVSSVLAAAGIELFEPQAPAKALSPLPAQKEV